MTIDEFVKHYPVLYHMADARNWPSIQHHGLLSTTQLLQKLEIADSQAVEDQRAHGPVRLENATHGTVFIRDQHQIRESQLERCLIDMTPLQWRASLNSRVFFWPTLKRLKAMFAYYQVEPQLIITIPARLLIEAYQGVIELSRINSGFVMRKPALRGSHTFQKLDDFQHSSKQKVAELTIPGAVPDLLKFAQDATIRQAGRRNRVVFKNSKTL
jgi:hypothetical protein